MSPASIKSSESPASIEPTPCVPSVGNGNRPMSSKSHDSSKSSKSNASNADGSRSSKSRIVDTSRIYIYKRPKRHKFYGQQSIGTVRGVGYRIDLSTGGNKTGSNGESKGGSKGGTKGGSKGGSKSGSKGGMMQTLCKSKKSIEQKKELLPSESHNLPELKLSKAGQSLSKLRKGKAKSKMRYRKKKSKSGSKSQLKLVEISPSKGQPKTSSKQSTSNATFKERKKKKKFDTR